MSQYSKAQLIYKSPLISDDTTQSFVYLAFSQLYNFQFQSCDSTLKKMKEFRPYSPWHSLVSANYYWWKMISGENTIKNKESFYQQLSIAEKSIGHHPTSYESLFCLIMVYSYKSRIDLMEGNYGAAIRQLRNYYKTISSSFEKEDNYEAFNLTSGLYNYLSSRAFNDYMLLRPFLYLFERGNAEKGIKFLGKGTRTGDILLETECNYFLMKIFFEIEKKPTSALKYAQLLNDHYPKNFVFNYYHYKISNYYKAKKLSDAEKKILKKQILADHQLSDAQISYFNFLLNFEY